MTLLPVLLLLMSSLASWSKDNQADTFLEQHWDRPLDLQGEPPDNYPRFDHHPLSPQSCGQCHIEQYSQWQITRHAKAMGPGVIAQMLPVKPGNRQQLQACLRCHAPLAEQQRTLEETLAGRQSGTLHTEGLTCAGCHVRGYKWYGPPRRDGSFPADEQRQDLPHDGWISHVSFESSEFCSACHQFETGGFALNGKLLENTYVEWRNSRYAEDGIGCQDCHMPQRRHEFKGIHNLEATADGITVVHGPLATGNELVHTSIEVTNDGAGHHFPTYVTPRVTVEAFQTNRDGEELAKSRQTLVIARDIALNLSEERFDSRLAPDEQAIFEYNNSLHPEARYLISRIRVEPDYFYKGFYRFYLAANIEPKQKKLYQQALNEAVSSDFELHSRRYDLSGAWTPMTVKVPAGEFVAGSDQEEREFAYRLDEKAYGHDRTRQSGWYDGERPRDVYRTSVFEITVTPVTNAQYARFVRETGHRVPDVDPGTWESYGLVHPYARTRRHAWTNGEPPAGREQHPVVLVSRSDAIAYAEWLSGTTGDKWRLPTALEWEKAARGTDGRRFPWGERFDAGALNSHDAGPFDTTPVGVFPGGASPFGVLDAAGQVYEWTATDGNPGRGVVKGGSWDDKGCGVCRTAARHARPVDLKHILIGFRLVRETEQNPK